MKLKYPITALITALPFAVITILIWQWPNIKNLAKTPSLPTTLGEKLANSISQSPAPPPTESWKVLKVADGDTITVQRGSIKEKIRFCGIDSPELKRGSAPGQPLGRESKANLQRLIDEAHGEVQLSIVDSDRYGRKVAEVFTVLGDGKERFLQEEQLKSGLAYHYAKYSSSCPNRDAIVKAEAIAHSAGLGVWSGSHELPWEYRKRNR